MFTQIKGYLAIAGAFLVALLFGIFKYRGQKIDNLEVELEVAEEKAKVVDKVIKAEKDVLEFETEARVKAAKAEARDYENITEHFYSI